MKRDQDISEKCSSAKTRFIGYNGCVSMGYEGQTVKPEEAAVSGTVAYLRRFVSGRFWSKCLDFRGMNGYL